MTCHIPGCHRPGKRDRGTLCEAHYYRRRRTGSFSSETPIVERNPGQACRIAGCEKPSFQSGLCSMHHARQKRNGDPLALRGRPAPSYGPDSPGWRADQVTYGGAHSRVRRQRGSAKALTCPCGAPARQWAYDHADPNERQSKWGSYSPDPVHYVALCVPCHKRMDLDRLAQSTASAP